MLAAAALLVLVASAARAGEASSWLGWPDGNPTDFGSPRLDPGESQLVPPGEWSFALAASEFNAWRGSWQTATFHRALGRIGLPIDSEEIRTIEAARPNDEIYRIDVEGWRADLSGRTGIGGGVTVGFRMVWIEIGSPHWDAVAENVHRLFGLTTDARDLFPRGDTLVYIRGSGGRVEARHELDGSGLGDTALFATRSLGQWFGGDQRLAVIVEVPTGKRGTLRGSGGWDAGVRWFGVWTGNTIDVLAGAGWNRLDRSGSFLGLRRANTWNVDLEGRFRLGRSLEILAGARLDASPLRKATSENLGDPALVYFIGFSEPIGASGNIAFRAVQDAPQVGVGADWVFQLQTGYKW